MLLPVYLGLLAGAETTLAESWRQLAEGHGAEPDVTLLCRALAKQCDDHVAALAPVLDRYGSQPDDEPERLHVEALAQTRTGPLGLLRDLQDVHVLTSFVDVTWAMVYQAAQAVRDTELIAIIEGCRAEIAVQLAWLTTRMKAAAPQALLVA